MTADMLIVGAGPAGCSAAVQAAGLGMTSIVVDSADRPGGALWRIGHLENLPGSWTDGPSYAEALGRDLDRLGDRCRYIQGEAVRVDAGPDHASVELADGRILTSKHLVVATGVRGARVSDIPWVTCAEDVPPLWNVTPGSLGQRTVVLGADRPLGTWLRTHPEFDQNLTVLHPVGDDYKADEVRSERRVQLERIEQVSVLGTGPFEVEFTRVGGERETVTVEFVVINAGSVPASLPGLVTAIDGYCPPEDQHPRIRTAGDLRSRRYQRVQIAGGSGAEAALAHYYGAQRSNGDAPTQTRL
ncbi:NAD(P)/FAD-dependent oxidoreductase [Kitasatospora purpeofusca]|uniref:NAD(P)/FAD-dependent oxidoreductase n=1 Tax=Kitasatospora purpeofusca TaxID=67352 RepID=UPI0035D655C9